VLLLAGWNNLNHHAEAAIQPFEYDCDQLTSEDSELPELEHIPSDPHDTNPQSMQSTSQQSSSSNDDWYVFDPVFGVIPRETRDLWKQQAVETGDKRSGIARDLIKVRPVRYSNEGGVREGTTENNSTGLEASTIRGIGGGDDSIS